MTVLCVILCVLMICITIGTIFVEFCAAAERTEMNKSNLRRDEMLMQQEERNSRQEGYSHVLNQIKDHREYMDHFDEDMSRARQRETEAFSSLADSLKEQIQKLETDQAETKARVSTLMVKAGFSK